MVNITPPRASEDAGLAGEAARIHRQRAAQMRLIERSGASEE